MKFYPYSADDVSCSHNNEGNFGSGPVFTSSVNNSKEIGSLLATPIAQSKMRVRTCVPTV